MKALRDQFIFGLINKSTQQKLFTQRDGVKLHNVVGIALAQEAAELSTSMIRGN